MSLDEIRELLRLFNESGVGELEVQRGEDRVRIKKGLTETVAPPAPAFIADTMQPASVAAPRPPVIPNTPAASAPPAATPQPDEHIVKSPIIGTFYSSPSPEAPPFVKVGDTIKRGQVLCIIEAMKLFNEIESDVDGTVIAQLAQDANPVEYDQPLFAIRTH